MRNRLLFVAAVLFQLGLVCVARGQWNQPLLGSGGKQTGVSAQIGLTQAITDNALTNASFSGGAPSGTVVGTISTIVSPSTPAFSGTYSLSGSRTRSQVRAAPPHVARFHPGRQPLILQLAHTA